VFDPCAGGLTTAWAASTLNRNFICCELNEEYYNKGIEFLKKEINYKE
jgi:DNA modification methylase